MTPGGGGTLQVFLQYTNLICEYMQSLGWQVSNTSSHGPLAGGAGATGAGGLVGGLVGGLGACPVERAKMDGKLLFKIREFKPII